MTRRGFGMYKSTFRVTNHLLTLVKRNITNITNAPTMPVNQHYAEWYLRDICVIFLPVSWYFLSYLAEGRHALGVAMALTKGRACVSGRVVIVSAVRQPCLTHETFASQRWDARLSAVRHVLPTGHKYHANIMQISCKYHTSITQISHKYHANITRQHTDLQAL